MPLAATVREEDIAFPPCLDALVRSISVPHDRDV